MTKPIRIALFVAVPLLILLLPIAVYVVDVSANEGTIARNVSVAGIDVSGMSAEEALVAVGAYEDELSQPAVFVVNDQTYELDPRAVGLQVTTEEAVAEALQQRQGGLVSGFAPWMRSFGQAIDIPLEVTVDGDAIDANLAQWEADAVAEPAFEGAVMVVSGSVEYEYPRDGLALDLDTSHGIVETSLLTTDRTPQELPLLEIASDLTEDDIDEAVETVEKLIAKPVKLRNEKHDLEFVMQPADMAAAVRVDVITESPARIEVALDEEVVDSFLEPQRPELETEPTQVVIDTNIATNGVTVTPGEAGTAVDAVDVTPALYRTALAGRTGHLPVGEGEQPEWTEEEIEAWGPLGRVSDFTTKHPAGQPRVTNIQEMARTVDETIVWPGETFSINAIVGRRTEAKGYVADGAIINGEVACCDHPANIGGGVSQFATT
ncbi:MAG: VanW family protein, partial [Actinomycetota bacterium]|nr:VanW family protein [Actinomycetota bacterium]